MILVSHLGRPNGKVVDSLRLRPVAQRLGQLLGRTVPVTGDALGVGTEDAIRRLKPGQVLLLENLRFHAEEEKQRRRRSRSSSRRYGDVVRQRRVRHRPPRARLDRRRGEAPARLRRAC